MPSLFLTQEVYDLQKNSPEFQARAKGKEIKIMPSARQTGTPTAAPARPLWDRVKDKWKSAESFVAAVKSRGVGATLAHVAGVSDALGERVDEATFARRKASCFSCINLNSVGGLKYCNACGCGRNKLALISDENNPDTYTKLFYPDLQCPLGKPGFSNAWEDSELSIVMPVLNDQQEANETIKSIRATAPAHVEIIAVDDGSDIPLAVSDKSVITLRNEKRLGAGKSRHLGALRATKKHLLFIDAHMRFTENWFDKAMSRVVPNPKTLWCSACLGLDATNMDVSKPTAVYTGSRLVLLEFDQFNRANVFDAVWQNDRQGDDYEIGSVMGAAYFCHRDWFFHIRGLESSIMYGSEEPFISVKTWLAGGEVRLMKSVRIGHKFRAYTPYSTASADVIYNRVRPVKTLFSDDVFQFLASKMSQDADTQAAFKRLEAEKASVEEERAYYQKIFVHDLSWLCEKFQIPQPWLTPASLDSQVSL